MKTKAEFWFDPICPWAWMTSRWILEVEKVRDIEVNWNLFSLAHLNRDKELSEEYKKGLIRSWRTTRVIAAAQKANGATVTLPLYTAISSRIHLQKQEVNQALFEAALEEVGLDKSLAAAMNDESFDAAIIESHERGIKLVGNDVGTPIISVEGAAFFGPVISPAPKGEEAGKLWDGVVGVASYPGFFEIKRSRTVGPIFE
ncbi:MAG: DsbA family protein [Candidatus Nanopelagicaceae bacterium]|nr:DsbA family protein [Candidatus Nanopelagicaceae bacterium]